MFYIIPGRRRPDLLVTVCKRLISDNQKFGTILFLALLSVCSRLPAFYFIITYIK